MEYEILMPAFSVVKFPPSAAVPEWALTGEFYNITRTSEELSIVCPSSSVPVEGPVEAEHGWSCLRIAGTLDFSLTGILASFAVPLAEAKISIFAISTYNTDYLLIRSAMLDQAKAVLDNAGHSCVSSSTNRAKGYRLPEPLFRRI